MARTKQAHPSLQPGERWFIIISLSLLTLAGLVSVSASLSRVQFHAPSAAGAPSTVRGAGDPLMTIVPRLNDMLAAPRITATDPVIGSADASVTLTLFSDMTCWYCGQTMQAALAVQAAYPDQVRVVHKDFPEPNKSYASYQAAIAARCAQRQGAFWELSGKLYEHYDQLTDERITQLAGDIPTIDAAVFKECRAGRITQPVTQLIDSTIAEANALEISGVPVVYINDKALFGQTTEAELRAAVAALLN